MARTSRTIKLDIGNGSKTVVDATRDLVINVTRSDVKKGTKRRPDCCAAAVAILREEKAKSVRVHRARVYVDYGDKVVRFITPTSLRTDLVAFDLYGKFAEGQHVLIKPTASQRLGAMRGYKPTRTNSGRRRPQHTLFGVRGKATNKPHDTTED